MPVKIRNPFWILPFIFVIFLTFAVSRLTAQDSLLRPPAITNDWKIYEAQVLHDSAKKMMELKMLIPGLVYDLRYAGPHNFMHRSMYPSRTRATFLRLPAAIALGKVQAELKEKGLGLKIFDAYRPYSVTVKFWQLVHDERYVANPARGSGHNRGIAVDLTLIHLDDGKELEMGTGFDNFTDTAHQGFTGLPGIILQNRLQLRSIMEKYGFRALETEWWHYSLPDGNRFEVLDVKFKELQRKSR